jgi:hypothetical protein
MTVRELITTWGFDIDTKPLAELEERVRGVRETVMHLGELILGEGASLFGLAESTAEAGVGFKRTAEEVGTTTKRLQELNYVAKQWDVKDGVIESGMRHLARVTMQAAQGSTEAIRSLSMAGVKDFRDGQGHMLRTDQLLSQVASKFKTMRTDAEKSGLAMEVFGRSGTQMMPILNRWGKEFEATAKEGRDLGYVMGDEAIEASERFKASTNEVRAMLTGLRNQLGVALMPAIEGMVKEVIAWYNANRKVISGQIVEFAQKLGEVVHGAFEMVVMLSNGTMWLADHLGGLGNVLKIVTAGFIAWTALNIVVLLGSATEAVITLSTAMGTLASMEALATGGLSAVLGIAAALGVGAYAYHVMHGGVVDNSRARRTMAPGAAGHHTTIHQSHTWHVQLPPGTTAQQAAELGKAMDQHVDARLRTFAFAASSPQSH